MQLEQEVSDVEFVPEELAFLNQSNDVFLLMCVSPKEGLIRSARRCRSR